MKIETDNKESANNMTFKSYKPKLELAIVFICLITIFTPAFLLHVPSMDEIWNYQFARRILYGQVPYKDFYLIITPFAVQINSLFLLIGGDKLIIIRLVGIMVFALNGLILFKILRVLNNSTERSSYLIFLYAFIVTLLPENNYSWFAILFMSAALYMEVKTVIEGFKKIAKPSNDIIIGILLGLTVISKQNIGLVVFFVSTIFLVYFTCLQIKYNRAYFSIPRISVFYFIKRFFLKTLSFLTVIGMELIYIWVNGSLKEFIDQTITAVTEFRNILYIPYTHLVQYPNILISVFSVLAPIIIAGALFKGLFLNKDLESKSVAVLTALYSIANITIVYPLADPGHLIMGMPLVVLSLSVLLQKHRYSNESMSGINRRFLIVGLFCIMPFVLNPVIPYMKLSNMAITKSVNHYEGIPLTKDSLQSLKDINNYIIRAESQGKRVHIMDYRAAFFLIPLDKFSYKSDTMLVGNMGSNGETEILEMLSRRNTSVLITGGNKPSNWAEAEAFRSYVMSHMKYNNSLGAFDIYENKD